MVFATPWTPAMCDCYVERRMNGMGRKRSVVDVGARL